MKYRLEEVRRPGTVYTDFCCGVCGDSPKPMRGWFGDLPHIYSVLAKWHLTRCKVLLDMTRGELKRVLDGTGLPVPRIKKGVWVAECPCGNFKVEQKTEWWANKKLTDHYSKDSPECANRYLFDMKVRKVA